MCCNEQAGARYGNGNFMRLKQQAGQPHEQPFKIEILFKNIFRVDSYFIPNLHSNFLVFYITQFMVWGTSPNRSFMMKERYRKHFPCIENCCQVCAWQYSHHPCAKHSSREQQWEVDVLGQGGTPLQKERCSRFFFQEL